MSRNKHLQRAHSEVFQAVADHIDIGGGIDIDTVAPAAYRAFCKARALGLPPEHFKVVGAEAIREAWLTKVELEHLTPDDFNGEA